MWLKFPVLTSAEVEIQIEYGMDSLKRLIENTIQ